MLYENICVKNVFDENILPNSVWLQENDLVFSSAFEKVALKQQNRNIPLPPPPPPHTHIKIQRAKGSINGLQGKGTSFIKQ